MSDLSFIHRFIPGTAPTILLLHGTGGDELDLLGVGPLLAPGAALLSPRGQVLENGMPRFFRRLAEGVFDQEDLSRRTDDLAVFIASAAQHFGFDSANVIAAGFSNGANIAASLLLAHPGVLRAAILFAPMVPFTPTPLPDLHGTTVFIGAGRVDPLISQAQTEELADLLRATKADVTLSWHDSGHMLTRPEIAAAADWLRENNLID